MKTVDAMKAFKVSRRQVQRIKAEDPNLVRVHKKHPSKFTNEMKTDLLHQLDQKSSTTLAEMVCFIKERFDVRVSTQAISNLIHNMDIFWKQVTNIPASWNKPELIENQARSVNNQMKRNLPKFWVCPLWQVSFHLHLFYLRCIIY